MIYLIEDKDYINVAKECDYVIVSLGEEGWMSGEGGARSNINLSDDEIQNNIANNIN